MSNRILVNPAVKAGNMLVNFISTQQVAIQQGRRIKAIIDSAQYGDPADWAAVASELGLTGQDAATQAQAVATILSNAMSQIDSAQVAELSRLDQG